MVGKRTLLLTLLVTCALAASLVPSPALALRVYTTGAADGYAGRSWYGWYGSGAETGEATVRFWHDSSNRESGRGMVIFDISSLAGVTLTPGSARLNFYSLGIGGVHLQHYGADPGSQVVAGFSQASGAEIAYLNVGEGWQSFDVTDHLNGDIAGNFQRAGFIFNADNFCGGSIAAHEGGLDRVAYLEVAVPEPGSLLAIASGIIGLAGAARRSRRR